MYATGFSTTKKGTRNVRSESVGPSGGLLHHLVARLYVGGESIVDANSGSTSPETDLLVQGATVRALDSGQTVRAQIGGYAESTDDAATWGPGVVPLYTHL